MNALVTATFLLLQVTAPAAQTYRDAVFAWRAGDYPAALRSFERILASTDAPAYHDSVALVTGELYRTREITGNGRSVQLAPDARWIGFERGGHVHLVALDGASRHDSVAALRFAFSNNGLAVVYVRRGNGNSTQLVHRELNTGRERTLADDAFTLGNATFGSDDASVYFVARRAPSAETHVWSVRVADGVIVQLTSGAAPRGEVMVVPGGRYVVYTTGRDALSTAGQAQAPPGFVLRDLQSASERTFAGAAPAFARDGSAMAWVAREGDESRLYTLSLGVAADPLVVKRAAALMASPAFAPDGRRLAFMFMPREDYELYTIGVDGSDEVRLTREIQHDVGPVWLTATRILARLGEPRHQRSHLHEVTSGARTRLFHNNTVRTIAPEYEWAVSRDGNTVAIVADRDGNTVSPERGVYVMDLTAKVSPGELLQRVRDNLRDELALREKARETFAPIAADVRRVTEQVSKERLYEYQRNLFLFDSKHITRPGNAKAIEYLKQTYESFGYAVELQWFEPRPGIRSANVIATLRGTVSPDVLYVVGSHFDSVADGPGADDNTSGTSMLLETARVLAGRPQAATIQFVTFTAEEAGLLGSREYVRRLQADSARLAGVMNNDMMGWSNDERLDNTIRYSNPGIRDVQHAAALGFSRLITYDALYYRSTDAAAFYEVYGDIVGGFGSYPVLGNPHYHRVHDVLETINQEQVTENTRANVATMMLLANAPARLTGLTAQRTARSGATVQWNPSLEKDVAGYVVRWEGAGGRSVGQRVTQPRISLSNVRPGTTVEVRAVNARGLAGWDWARVTIR